MISLAAVFAASREILIHAKTRSPNERMIILALTLLISATVLIRGGDPTGTSCGVPGYAIKDEFNQMMNMASFIFI